MKTVTAIVAACTFVLATSVSAKPVQLYILYDLSQKVHGATDDREVRTSIFLTPDHDLNFSYGEGVSGATTPVVKSISFSHQYEVKATPDEEAAVARALTDAGIFDLKSDADYGNGDYNADLTVEINHREVRYSFYTPAGDPRRTAVHKILLDFAAAHKLTEPGGPYFVTTVSEGDQQPARPVSFAEVLAHPDDYDGKRVLLTGYFHGQFEEQNFCVDPASAKRWLSQEPGPDPLCLWYGEPSTFAKEADFIVHNDSWQRVEGVFVKGPTGHMGLWPGKIQRLTRSETTVAPR